MSIDDRYRARLQAAIASLRYWVPTISDAAHITQSDGGTYWSLSAEPHISGACPFELVLRDDGRHDIMIAGESYEDLPTEDLDVFVPLACAIARGDVTRRITSTSATGIPISVETIIQLDGAKNWHKSRALLPPGQRLESGDAVVSDRRFLPYRRD